LSADIRKRIGEFGLYGIFILVDAFEVWPQSHFVALLAFVGGLIFLLLIDRGFSRTFIFVVSALACVASFVIYFAAAPSSETLSNQANSSPPSVAPNSNIPAIPFEDTEVHGWLRPSNDPTPPNGCDNIPPTILTSDFIKVLIGNNALGKTGLGKVTAIEIGTCDVLSMERTSEGIFVNADLFDGTENPTRIRKNEIFALNGENYSARKTRDFSTLTIKNNRGQELLYVRYINPSTLRARGTFSCTGHRPVVVKDDQPVPGIFMSNNCFMNAGKAAIHVD
jgi:hypothetical protein